MVTKGAGDDSVESWGRYPKAVHRNVEHPSWVSEAGACIPITGTVLPYGQGRSYGDVCLNDGGDILATAGWNRFMAFNPHTGVLRAEAGVVFADIIRLVTPCGWFLPVTPGTMWISLGGAVANDVHGKNHHRAGCFGNHVLRFELVRSDGSRTICSPSEHPTLFAATIGGMGLTGIMTWVEIQLVPIASRLLVQESVKLPSLLPILAETARSESDWEYVVSWIDVTARGSRMGRGHVLRANWKTSADGTLAGPVGDALVRIPFEAPSWLLNGASIALFNSIYYHRQLTRLSKSHLDLQPFFYPLDVVGNWNRLYGSRGMLQYQCVVPHSADTPGIVRTMIGELQREGVASFLAVVKNFGDTPSPGMMSFPRPGTTLSLDVAHSGADVMRALDRCDAIVLEAGGRLYPAKDARMAPSSFKRMYPQWETFAGLVDPAFSSSFWRRVTS